MTSPEEIELLKAILAELKEVNSARALNLKEIDKASYYPEDEKYLVKLEPKVKHYEVLVSP